jgi:hypothetical protein
MCEKNEVFDTKTYIENICVIKFEITVKIFFFES